MRPFASHQRTREPKRALAHPSILQYDKLLARLAVADLDQVAGVPGLAIARSLKRRVAPIAKGSRHAVVQDFVALPFRIGESMRFAHENADPAMLSTTG